MMKAYARYFALLYLSIQFVQSVLLGSQTSVQAHQFMAKSYAKAGTFEFAKDSSYPLVKTTSSGFYLQVNDGHDWVVFLNNEDNKLPAKVKGDQLLFWENHTYQTDRAYLTFRPDDWYRVLSESATQYKIEYKLGKTTMRCSVEKAEFSKTNHILDADGQLIDRLVSDAKDAICVLNFSNGTSGSGFLLYSDHQLYCYTNHHVAMNAGRLTVNLIDGTAVKVGAVEISEDSDLARFKVLSERPGLEVVASPQLQERVTVLGNSFGTGRITVLRGKVSGLNEATIETTAKFVSGNSGSPILNDENQVIGVATLVELFPDHQKIATGSIFEDGRRVGVRLDRNIEWVPVNMGQFMSSNRLIQQTIQFIDELPEAMVAALSDEATQKLTLLSLNDTVIKQWLRSRTARLQAIRQKHITKVNTGVARQGNLFIYTPAYAAIEKSYNDAIIVESEKYWNSLQQKVVAKKRSLSRATPYPDTSFMRQEIAYSLEMLEVAQAVVKLIQESHHEYTTQL